jgi:hypothetical protein
MIAHFIDSHMWVAISLDAVRHVMCCGACFTVVTGIPMEQERLEADFFRLKTFIRVYKAK